MRKIAFAFLLCIFISLFALLFAQPVSADGGEPRLEIGAERLNPGSVLEIRGVDFEMEEEISLALIGSQVEIPLGTVTSDFEGIFKLALTLPADLTEGRYTVRATTNDHLVDSPGITVWGIAQVQDPEGGQREQEDGLLAPMPTHSPGLVSTPLPQRIALETSASKPDSTTLIYSILLGIGIIALAGTRLLKKR
ncbi:MAG TPA: hypothetical protein VK249_07025 [Anaerolineales bacterium]|nr:hypothetical protein [Anaerolineales bacterium]